MPKVSVSCDAAVCSVLGDCAVSKWLCGVVGGSHVAAERFDSAEEAQRALNAKLMDAGTRFYRVGATDLNDRVYWRVLNVNDVIVEWWWLADDPRPMVPSELEQLDRIVQSMPC